MSFQCHGEKCGIMRWMRIVLVAGGVYHFIFALWAILCPMQALGWFDCAALSQPLMWQMFGVISVILGLGLIIASKNPIQHWPIVLLGFIESIVGDGVYISITLHVTPAQQNDPLLQSSFVIDWQCVSIEHLFVASM